MEFKVLGVEAPSPEAQVSITKEFDQPKSGGAGGSFYLRKLP